MTNAEGECCRFLVLSLAVRKTFLRVLIRGEVWLTAESLCQARVCPNGSLTIVSSENSGGADAVGVSSTALLSFGELGGSLNLRAVGRQINCKGARTSTSLSPV